MIEVRQLVKRYGENVAVDGISFEIGPGEVVGLLGPNGAGKTTTMRMLTTFLPPDGGEAVVAGASVRENAMGVRRQLGYLPEGPPLYPEMTILAYLGHLGRLRGLRRADRKRRIEEMVEVCDLGAVLDREIAQLSRGYRQRVGLAGTLLHQPAVLVLDEPTTGLDPNQVRGIRSLIRSVAEDRTVLLSSHVLSEVEATCDRVLILADGRLQADRPVGALDEEESATARFRIGLLGKVDDARLRLEAAEFVLRSKLLQSDDRAATFEVEAPAADGDEQLFRWTVEQGLTLVELVRVRSSLEEVFVGLTRKKESAE